MIAYGVPGPNGELVFARVVAEGKAATVLRDDETAMATTHDVRIREQSMFAKGADGVSRLCKTSLAARFGGKFATVDFGDYRNGLIGLFAVERALSFQAACVIIGKIIFGGRYL